MCHVLQTFRSTREKVSTKLHFSWGWTLKKYRNKVEMKEHKKTTQHLQKFAADVGSLHALFHLCLVSALFSASIPIWNEVLQKSCSLVTVLFGWFLNHLPNRTCFEIISATHFWIPYHTADEHVYREQRDCVQSSAKNTGLATSDFQTEIKSKSLLLTGTHLWKWVVSRTHTHLSVHYNPADI